MFHLWLWGRLLTNWTLKHRAWCKKQVAFVVILKSRLPPMHIWGWKLQQWTWCIEPHSLNKCFNWKDFAGKALWLNGLPGLRWGASAVALAAIPNPLWFIASTALCLYEGSTCVGGGGYVWEASLRGDWQRPLRPIHASSSAVTIDS